MKVILKGNPQDIAELTVELSKKHSRAKKPRLQLVRADIGLSIERLRTEAGCSQLEFSELLGISQKRLSKIELAEEEVTLELAEQIAKALGCDVSELLSGREGKEVYRNIEIYE